jgi:hypothetical protein
MITACARGRAMNASGYDLFDDLIDRHVDDLIDRHVDSVVDAVSDPDPAIVLAGELLVDAVDLSRLGLPQHVIRALLQAVAPDDVALVDRVMVARAQIQVALVRKPDGPTNGFTI